MLDLADPRLVAVQRALASPTASNLWVCGLVGEWNQCSAKWQRIT